MSTIRTESSGPDLSDRTAIVDVLVRDEPDEEEDEEESDDRDDDDADEEGDDGYSE